MKTINVYQTGFETKIGSKLVKSPFSIQCDERTSLQITKELKKQGVTDFAIKSKPGTEVKKTKTVKNIPLAELKKRYQLNYKKDRPDSRDHMPAQLKAPVLREIQKSIDVIDYTPEMSYVKDQGVLGSCVGFAVVAMKEWQEQQEHLREVKQGKKYKRNKAHYDLSEQWMYYKCKEIDYWPGEEGTSIRFAMKVLNRVGVPTEKAWPYDDDYIGEPESWAKLVSKWAIGGEYIRLLNVEDIINSLKTNGPLPIGIGVFIEMFYTGRDGVTEYPSNPDMCYGGHAVCLVGWDPNTRMFKFKNSWGTGWGEDGYGYISYDYMRDFCWDAWMIKDLNVTKDMLRG